jgi:hypothetical protein
MRFDMDVTMPLKQVGHQPLLSNVSWMMLNHHEVTCSVFYLRTAAHHRGEMFSMPKILYRYGFLRPFCYKFQERLVDYLRVARTQVMCSIFHYL